jgi:hypothetical protein
MHPTAAHHKLTAQIRQVEARTVARLAKVESDLGRLLSAAGLPFEPFIEAEPVKPADPVPGIGEAVTRGDFDDQGEPDTEPKGD